MNKKIKGHLKKGFAVLSLIVINLVLCGINNLSNAQVNTSINDAGLNQNTDRLEVCSYPNPVITIATIEFQSQIDSKEGIVEIYSIEGRKIAELLQSNVKANTKYQLKWDATEIPNGVYFYKVDCGGKSTMGRLMVLN